ncbi:MAG: glutamine synthetase family protein [Ferrimicrobium sp.]|uniref:glutamine synthetase family protein n=1 Tax=Ferrimicrobium sp. TaxID=2926050 RepID=UPI00262339C6|nr:glutamine synthetase family protein [Ferrimicrobium sp.]
MSQNLGGGGDFAWVKLVFTDLSGTARAVQIPGATFDQAISEGVRVDGSALEGRNRLIETDLVLKPDPTTLLPSGQGSGRVICDLFDEEGSPWPLDPRHALRQMVATTSIASGDWEGAAELEWYLLRPDFTPVDGEGYFSYARGEGERLLAKTAEQLLSLNVPLSAAHHEAGPGQYEVNLTGSTPLALADTLMNARTIIADLAYAEGLIATFMARPLNELPGSGMHIHQVVPGEDPTDAMRVEQIIGGVLQHASALCAFGAPTINSYRRLHRGAEAPSHATWAQASRSALVRLSRKSEGFVSIEYRGSDSSANPYLVIAALLAAAETGVIGQAKLPAPLEESVEGVGLAQVETAPTQLPRSLEQAIRELVADDQLIDCFDDRLINRYSEDLMAEVEASQGYVSDWEQQRYLGSR